MRSRSIRIALAVLALVGAAILFVVARPDDDSTREIGQPVEAAREPEAPPAAGAPGTEAEEPARAEPAPLRPRIQLIRVAGGKPTGGVERISVNKGETLRFRVRSDAPHHVHLHGFDVTKDVAPGQDASFRVKADLEGIFEVELEDSAVPIAEVRVSP